MNLFKSLIAGFIWCGILFSLHCYGQTEAAGIPLGSMPMQYNGSFAGETGSGRLSTVAAHNNLIKGASHPSFPRIKFNTFGIYTSYDLFIPSLSTGIGVTTGYAGARTPFNDQNALSLSLAVAPKISIKGKYTLSPSLDFSRISGNDTPDPSFYSIPGDEIVTSRKLMTSKAGLLFNTNKYYIGYSVFLVNQLTSKSEKATTKSSLNREGFKSFLQLGYTFQRSSESKFSFTPQLAIPIFEEFFPQNEGIILPVPNFNFTFRYQQYIAGINDTGFHLGIQNERLRLMFSSSFGIYAPSNRSAYSTGSEFNGNLSFRYIFKNSEKGWNKNLF